MQRLLGHNCNHEGHEETAIRTHISADKNSKNRKGVTVVKYKLNIT